MQRRSLLKLFGTSAIAIAGSSLYLLPALTQQRPDNPTDCTPPESREKPRWHLRQTRICRSAPEKCVRIVEYGGRPAEICLHALRKLTTKIQMIRAGGCAKAMFIAGIAVAAATARGRGNPRKLAIFSMASRVPLFSRTHSLQAHQR